MLIGACMVMHFTVVLPNIVGEYGVVTKILHWTWSAHMCCLVAFNYYKVVTTSSQSHLATPEHRTDYRICQKCVRLKPERAHHCSICNSCILRMDHHCMFHSSVHVSLIGI